MALDWSEEMPKATGSKRVWSLLQPSVADLSFWMSGPFPPPSQPERIFSTSGTFIPPVPMREVSVWTVPSSAILMRLSMGGLSSAIAAGTTPARSVGARSGSKPMPRLSAECSVQKPAASSTQGGCPWCSARSVAATPLDTSMQFPPWSFRQKPAAPEPAAGSLAALCHARKPSAEYPDRPSDSNSTCPAPQPAKSATRKMRRLRWGTPQYCASRVRYATLHCSPMYRSA